MASLYEFIIKDKSGNTLASLDSTRSRSFDRYLNKTGSAQFTISVDDPKLYTDLLLLGDKELYIYRAGVLVWGGELCNRQTSINADTREATITAKGFFDLLSKKIVGTAITPRVFTNTDAGTIASTLITESQTGTNASVGITIGSITASKNRDRTLDSWKTVKEVIESMCSLNIKDGFDFEVAPNKQFNVYYPKGSTKTNIVFEYGVNIIGLSESMDATEMANEVIAIGNGQGPATLVSTQDANSTIQGQYKIRQKTVSFKDIITQATLDDHALAELAQTQIQSQIIGITTKGDLSPGYGSYDIGDTVRVRITTSLFAIDANYRIYGIKVNISDEDEETIDITFNP